MNRRRGIPKTVLKIAAVALLGVVFSSGPSAGSDRDQVARVVGRIRAADYEGDRAALSRMYDELAPWLGNREMASRIRYWRGFALWRSALNGFNESEDPHELALDLGRAVTEFDSAAALDSAFVDARIGAAACLMNLTYLSSDAPDHGQSYVKRFVPLLAGVRKAAPDNPRLYWVQGPGFWYLTVEQGGGERKAFEAYERGLKAVEKEKHLRFDALDPTWGQPELLMSLAWSNLNRASPDLDAAERNAKAALKLVPNWHYVRDILLPQIRQEKQRGRPIGG